MHSNKFIADCRFKIGFGLLIAMTATSVGALAQGLPSPLTGDTERGVFIECLNEYKQHQHAEVLEAADAKQQVIDSIERIDEHTLEKLNPAQLQARYKTYNHDFQRLRALSDKMKSTISRYESKSNMATRALSRKERSLLKLNLRTSESNYQKLRKKLVIASLECNRSLLDYLPEDSQTSAPSMENPKKDSE